MLKHLFSFLLLSVITISSCFADTNTYRIKIGDFTRLKVFNNAIVVYRSNPDSVGYAVYTADKEMANAFIFSNNNKGVLRVEVATNHTDKKNLPVVTVYSRFIDNIESSSTECVFIESPMPCPTVKIKLIGNGKLIVNNISSTTTDIQLSTGNGTIVATGMTDKATIKTIGTGIIQADELEAKDVACSILGSGNIGCFPTENLIIKGIGSTKIYYKGEPKIKKSGGGTLIQIR